MSAESARRTVRILTWTGFATGIIGGLLIAFPKVIGPASPWVQLALGVATLVLAFRARKVGIDEVEGFDGRLAGRRPPRIPRPVLRGSGGVHLPEHPGLTSVAGPRC